MEIDLLLEPEQACTRAKRVCLCCTWMMAAWSDSEVFKLIDCWGEEGIEEQLEGSKHNKHVYGTVSKELWKMGVVKTEDQCCTEMKKLKLEYRKAKAGMTKLDKDVVYGSSTKH